MALVENPFEIHTDLTYASLMTMSSESAMSTLAAAMNGFFHSTKGITYGGSTPAWGADQVVGSGVVWGTLDVGGGAPAGQIPVDPSAVPKLAPNEAELLEGTQWVDASATDDLKKVFVSETFQLASGWSAKVNYNYRGEIVSINYSIVTIGEDNNVYGWTVNRDVFNKDDPMDTFSTIMGVISFNGPGAIPATREAYDNYTSGAIYGTDDPLINLNLDLEYLMRGSEAFPNGRYGGVYRDGRGIVFVNSDAVLGESDDVDPPHQRQQQELEFASDDGGIVRAHTYTDQDDVIQITTESDMVVLAGGGKDWIHLAGRGSALMHGEDGDDRIVTDAGADSLYGESGNDTLDGGLSDDLLRGGEGDDVLYGRYGKDTLDGGDGNDHLDAGEDDDFVNGAHGDDLLIGWTGDDTLIGGLGADTLDGGAGRDHAVYLMATSYLTIDLSTGLGSGGEAEGDRLTGIEDVTGGHFGNTIIGSAEANKLAGGKESDVLRGGAGDDTLKGDGGDDVLDDYGANGSVGGNDIMEGGLGNDTLFGRNGADTLLGGDGNDHLDAGEDDDRMEGGNGSDTLIGWTGNDQLNGGAGNDVLYGGAGADWFFFDANSGSDVIKDFGAGDVIRLSGVTVSTMDMWGSTNKPVTTSAGTVITVGADRVILVEGIRAEQLKGGIVNGSWEWHL